MTESSATIEDRIAGGLLGVHIGDCLGATWEFAPPNTGEPTRDIVGGGSFGWQPGEPTDDTELTAAVVRAYLDADVQAGRIPIERAAADRFVAWMERGPRDIGTTTRGALERVRAGLPLDATGGTHEGSAANGSLMRCIPTGLLVADPARRREETRRISRITHALDVCVDACVLYNDVAAGLVDGVDAATALAEALTTSPVGAQVRDHVRAVRDAGPSADPPFYGGARQGWVLGSLGMAVWALLQPEGEEALVRVANHGGDADTNAAIAGGWIGARDGASRLPTRWLRPLWLGSELRAAAAEFARLRGS